MWRSFARIPWLALLFVVGGPGIARGQSFLKFESGHVRPLALSPAGDRLFAVNTPDNRLAIYTLGAGGVTLAAEVPVGLDPVAVAARTYIYCRTADFVVHYLSNRVCTIDVHHT